MKTTLPCFVLLALLFSPFAHAQTAPAPDPGPGLVETPTRPPAAPQQPAAAPEREQAAAKPPSALDFLGRMALVTVGAAVGELALGYATYGLTRSTLGVETGAMAVVIGLNLGAGLGATLVGALVPGNNLGGTVGALAGSAVGLVASYLLRYEVPLVFFVPAVAAVLGYGIGYAIGMPKASETARRDEGIRISPIIALAPGGGGGQVGLAGVF